MRTAESLLANKWQDDIFYNSSKMRSFDIGEIISVLFYTHLIYQILEQFDLEKKRIFFVYGRRE